MKTILVIGVVVVIAFSVVADFLWRRWMAARRGEQDASTDRRA